MNTDILTGFKRSFNEIGPTELGLSGFVLTRGEVELNSDSKSIVLYLVLHVIFNKTKKSWVS